MKMLACFALRFAILFALMVWPWPWLQNFIGTGFRAQTYLLASIMLSPQTFRVEALSDPRRPTMDTIVLLAGGKTTEPIGESSVVEISFDSASQGWVPFVMWIALCVATPLPWPKRWRALLAGALVVETLVATTILVSVSYYHFTSAASPAWPLLPLMLANRLLVENIWFNFVLPFVLWIGWLAWGGHWEQSWLRLCGKCAPSKSKSRSSDGNS